MMKITKAKLKQIIKEELEAVMESTLYGPMKASPDLSRRNSRRTSRRDQDEFDSKENDFASAAYDSSLNTVGISSSEADAEGSYGIDARRTRRAIEKNYQDAKRALNSSISPRQKEIHRIAKERFKKEQGRSLRIGPNGAIDLSMQPDWVEDSIHLALNPLILNGDISTDEIIEFMNSLRAQRNLLNSM